MTRRTDSPRARMLEHAVVVRLTPRQAMVVARVLAEYADTTGHRVHDRVRAMSAASSARTGLHDAGWTWLKDGTWARREPVLWDGAEPLDTPPPGAMNTPGALRLVDAIFRPEWQRTTNRRAARPPSVAERRAALTTSAQPPSLPAAGAAQGGSPPAAFMPAPDAPADGAGDALGPPERREPSGTDRPPGPRCLGRQDISIARA